MAILTPHSIESRDRETATLALLLDLERREFDIHLDAAGDLVVEPQEALTFDDLCGLARYGDDLRAMVRSCLAA
jgi:hypothetical protein